ncbi:MAG: hypothetical protein Q8K78_08125 [Planctomycetaceae bacterium]|nr:hypothetical protein [Planctomycetaceae bacterium]
MLALFVMQLIAGISLMWSLMPRRQVTSGFFRIQMLLVLGLSVLVALVAGKFGQQSGLSETALTGIGIVMATLAFVGSVLWTLERRVPGAICGFAVNWIAMGALVQAGWHGSEATSGGVLPLASLLATAAVLGGTVTGMLLGHWYLTAPTMSIAPLSTLTRVLLVAVIVRLIVSGLCWWTGGDAIHGSLLWSWFALRWIAGILSPLVLCGMTLRILRYRNTQAATGVLFAAVILSFIGEMSATLLLSELHRPF